jgi:LPXTG-site transpeptidase (sortase) family protein
MRTSLDDTVLATTQEERRRVTPPADRADPRRLQPGEPDRRAADPDDHRAGRDHLPTQPSAPTAAVATPAASGTPAAPPVPLAPTATMIAPTATAPPAPPTAVPVVVGKPKRVKIPKIKVDADVEYVSLAPDGAMDVPKNYDNTAWYQLGPRPGEQGNSAIAGHVDSKTGKAVFWDLPKLQPGDEVFVVGDDGVERKFVVIGIASYKRTDAPLDRIFGPTTSRHLNLITCDPESGFNRTTSEYGGNVVVYTELIGGQ